MYSKASAVRRTLHAAADDTIASQPGGDRVTAVRADGGLRERSPGARSSEALRPPVLRRWENQRMLPSFTLKIKNY